MQPLLTHFTRHCTDMAGLVWGSAVTEIGLWDQGSYSQVTVWTEVVYVLD